MIELNVPWNMETPKVYSKINMDQLDLNGMTRYMLDALTEVEQWDLIVTSFELRNEGGFLAIEAYPDVEYRPGGTCHQKRALEWGVENCFQPKPVITNLVCIHCRECDIDYLGGNLHPSNGCSFGVVDNVLRT